MENADRRAGDMGYINIHRKPIGGALNLHEDMPKVRDVDLDAQLTPSSSRMLMSEIRG